MIMINNKIGRSFVAIMLVIAISALILRFAIEGIIKINISQNESTALETLKLISTALENYAQDHLGAYPVNLSVLTEGQPPYLDKNYLTNSSLKGYFFSCPRLESTGYSCSSLPAKCQLSGRMIYNVSTGGAFTSEECQRK